MNTVLADLQELRAEYIAEYEKCNCEDFHCDHWDKFHQMDKIILFYVQGGAK